MPEPTEPTGPTQTSAAAASQAASVRRVVAEAARVDPSHAARLVPGTLARAALAEAAGLLAHRPYTRHLPSPTVEPAAQDQHPARGAADDHHHDHDQHDQ
jgi:hypothetical protein